MLGWMITFALLALSGTLVGAEWQQQSLTTTGGVFAGLLLMFVLTRMLRSRA